MGEGGFYTVKQMHLVLKCQIAQGNLYLTLNCSGVVSDCASELAFCVCNA